MLDPFVFTIDLGGIQRTRQNVIFDAEPTFSRCGDMLGKGHRFLLSHAYHEQRVSKPDDHGKPD